MNPLAELPANTPIQHQHGWTGKLASPPNIPSPEWRRVRWDDYARETVEPVSLLSVQVVKTGEGVGE